MRELESVSVSVGDSVIVKTPKPNEEWEHSFIGSIIAIDSADDAVYTIEDEDGDCWDMERDRFSLDEEEED